VFCALFVAIVAFAWLFHLPFEAQTNRVRAFVKRLVLESGTKPYAGPRMRDS